MNDRILTIFAEHHLQRGRYLGDKGTFRRYHPDAIYFPGARVCDQTSVLWTGDLDLAAADASNLMAVAKVLGVTLYVHTEAFGSKENPAAYPAIVISGDEIEFTSWGRTYVPESMRAGKVLRFDVPLGLRGHEGRK